jgi:hypothetical protein
MVGSNPLWVAKQHGHSVTTMLRVYTAWTEGAIEADIKAIRRSMHAEPSPAKTSSSANSERQRISPRRVPPAPTPTQSGSCHLAADLAVRRSGDNLSTGDAKGIIGGERGIRTLEGLLTLTPLAGMQARLLVSMAILKI